MKFCSFASGSDGNCYYIGGSSCGILVDAGISIKSIKKNLQRIHVSLSSIQALFLTHDHYDHIASAGVLGEVFGIPVYATGQVHEGVQRCYKMREKLRQSKRILETGTTLAVGDLQITSFPVSHDSMACVGYYIQSPEADLTIATDMGYINPEAVPFLLQAKNLVMESNYDEESLLCGSYPLYLKKRILGDKGHLANHVTARFLAQHADAAWERVYFCHLSRENNSPDLLLGCLLRTYEDFGVPANLRPELTILPRTSPIDLQEL